ncbi:MAG: hypothetical protein K0A90_00250 [Methanosarcinaceae archaeon]|nr:hypothetical protein [Methanosarcinaceae archaeon]
MVEVSDNTEAARIRQEKSDKVRLKDSKYATVFEPYSNDIKMRSLKYIAEGHKAAYIRNALRKDGFEKIPTLVTLGTWKKNIHKISKTTTQQQEQVQTILDSSNRVAEEFEWLHGINRKLIERYYADPDTYSRELMISIREFHSQLRTAMEKLDMLKSAVSITYDMRSIMMTSEFNVASQKFLEDLVHEKKITINDTQLRYMVLGKNDELCNTD